MLLKALRGTGQPALGSNPVQTVSSAEADTFLRGLGKANIRTYTQFFELRNVCSYNTLGFCL